MKMFSRTVSAAAVLNLALISLPALADYSFSGSGTSGNFVGQASEPWAFNHDFQFGGTQPNWGSPGVSAGTTTYREAQAVYGLDITFIGGGSIDSASILAGNGANCLGTTIGGTTFCTISPLNIWTAIQTGPQSIAFRAQNPTFFLTNSQSYFVNVFFERGTDAPTGFSGTWLTSFTPVVPEVGSAYLLLSGIAGILGARILRRQKTK